MNKRDIKGRLIFYIEKILVLNFTVFLCVVPFFKYSVRVCFYVGIFFWLLLNILKFKARFYRGFIPPNPLNKPIAFFGIACLLSILFSRNIYHSQGVFFERHLFFAFFFWMGLGLAASSRKNLFLFVWVLIAWAFFFTVGGVRDYFFLFREIRPARLWTIYSGRQVPYYGFPLYLTYLIPFHFALALFARKRLLKAASLINTALLLLCLFWNASRGAWIATLASILFVGVIKNRRVAVATMAILAVLISAILFYPKTKERVSTIPHPSEWSFRMPLYGSALLMFRDYPVLGTGLGMYEKMLPLPQYALPEDYPIPRELNLHAHNTFLEVLAEMGVVGLAGFLWIFWAFFRRGIMLVKAATGRTADEQAVFLGLMGMALAILIFSLSTTILTVGLTVSSYFWFLFGLAASFLS